MKRLLLIALTLICTQASASKASKPAKTPQPIKTATGELVCPPSYDLNWNKCQAITPDTEKATALRAAALQAQSEDQLKYGKIAKYEAAKIYNLTLPKQSKATQKLLKIIKTNPLGANGDIGEKTAFTIIELQRTLQAQLNKLTSQDLAGKKTNKKDLDNLVAKIKQFNQDLKDTKTVAYGIPPIYLCNSYKF